MTLPPIGLGPSTSIYTEEAPRDLWPEPEQLAMDIIPGIAKPAVQDMAWLAERHGWSHRITEAIGCWPSLGQKPSRARFSQALRMWRGDQRAVAVYVEPPTGTSWQWITFYRWSIGEFPNSDANIGQFMNALFGPLCKPIWPGPKDWSCPYFGPVHGPAKR